VVDEHRGPFARCFRISFHQPKEAALRQKGVDNKDTSFDALAQRDTSEKPRFEPPTTSPT
jgi:hypothetical protein